MQRSIRFRAWEDGIMLSPAFTETTMALRGWKQDENYILMQFTGLLDRQGTEIYEGDILFHHKYGGHYQVVYSLENTGYDLTYALEGMPLAMHLGSGCCPNLEVIGNIYENPELLGEVKEVE